MHVKLQQKVPTSWAYGLSVSPQCNMFGSADTYCPTFINNQPFHSIHHFPNLQTVYSTHQGQYAPWPFAHIDMDASWCVIIQAHRCLPNWYSIDQWSIEELHITFFAPNLLRIRCQVIRAQVNSIPWNLIPGAQCPVGPVFCGCFAGLHMDCSQLESWPCNWMILCPCQPACVLWVYSKYSLQGWAR